MKSYNLYPNSRAREVDRACLGGPGVLRDAADDANGAEDLLDFSNVSIVFVGFNL